MIPEHLANEVMVRCARHCWFTPEELRMSREAVYRLVQQARRRRGKSLIDMPAAKVRAKLGCRRSGNSTIAGDRQTSLARRSTRKS